MRHATARWGFVRMGGAHLAHLGVNQVHFARQAAMQRHHQVAGQVAWAAGGASPQRSSVITTLGN
jgi:hypothetical protein